MRDKNWRQEPGERRDDTCGHGLSRRSWKVKVWEKKACDHRVRLSRRHRHRTALVLFDVDGWKDQFSMKNTRNKTQQTVCTAVIPRFEACFWLCFSFHMTVQEVPCDMYAVHYMHAWRLPVEFFIMMLICPVWLARNITLPALNFQKSCSRCRCSLSTPKCVVIIIFITIITKKMGLPFGVVDKTSRLPLCEVFSSKYCGGSQQPDINI